MTRHELCSTIGDFADAQEERAFILREARRIVLWAGSLTAPGEEIGGKGEQLSRAARLLQLHSGVVWRAYQRRSGPEIFPTIWEARNKLIERIARSPWGRIDGFDPTPRQRIPHHHYTDIGISYRAHRRDSQA